MHNQQWYRSLAALCGLAAIGILAFATTASAQDHPEYTDEGADTCLACHDESSDFPVLDIFKTRHGQQGNPHAPFGQLQCESCHGPGGEHAARVRRGRERPSIPVTFDHDTTVPVAQENGMCLGCHEGSDHVAKWAGSTHQSQDLRCVDCHQIHTTNDPVADERTQPEVCYSCHQQQRADSWKASVHPIRYGKMACTDCHQPHGSDGEHALVENTVTETCYTCHAEKRGPYLWEHPPAQEDCSHCHEPHGSNHPSLLTRRSPLLCQSCHSRSGHPSLALSDSDLPGQGGLQSAFLLSRGCMNCHSQVHGSNHPSGTKLTR